MEKDEAVWKNWLRDRDDGGGNPSYFMSKDYLTMPPHHIGLLHEIERLKI